VDNLQPVRRRFGLPREKLVAGVPSKDCVKLLVKNFLFCGLAKYHSITEGFSPIYLLFDLVFDLGQNFAEEVFNSFTASGVFHGQHLFTKQSAASDLGPARGVLS